ncbi:hypothetical protein AAFF_G00126410 [Aldrovandia affinis]|uniref:Ig-like domain-containing protein n=1 Tax=Aldrovandia affinis TaxID=143900 RepID=A0AAD7RRG2_9TELE|nr:hypothetical protein AAFF_G00126410 [Aldrovandia affinis]
MTLPRRTESIKEGDSVNLICMAKKCSLNKSELTWLKNGQPLRGTPSRLHFSSVNSENSGNYSCALKDVKIASHQIVQDVQYAPRNLTVSVSPSGEIVEGSSVTLTCSSNANPPAKTYTWFQKTEAVTSERGSGQSYNFTNISYEDSGEYYCVAQNKHGTQNSTVVALTVVVLGISSAVLAVALVVIIYFKRRGLEAQKEDPGSSGGTQENVYASAREPHLPRTRQQDHTLSSQEEVSYATVNLN